MKVMILILGFYLTNFALAGRNAVRFGQLELTIVDALLTDPFRVLNRQSSDGELANTLLVRHLDGVGLCIANHKTDAKKIRDCLLQATHPLGGNIWRGVAANEPEPVCR